MLDEKQQTTNQLVPEVINETKVINKPEEQKPAKAADMSIYLLKSDAYDVIAQINSHDQQIQQLQQKLHQINLEIIKKTQEEARAGK